MSVAALLVRTRTAAGLTQAALAVRARTSQAAVARYESGAVSPSVATLERLVRAAGGRLELDVVRAPAADLSLPQVGLLRSHRAEVLATCRHHGARNPRLFGSVARGTAGPDSDIDLVVDFDSSAGLLPLATLGDALSALLGYPVDVVPEDLLSDEVAAEVRATAVPL